MTVNHDQDGPDGLHRLHRMLSDAYGVNIPSPDYGAVIYLLDNLGVSTYGIEELMRRFTQNIQGQIRDDVGGIILKMNIVDERDILRVKSLLNVYGYSCLMNEPSPGWVDVPRKLDPQSPLIPTALRKVWRDLQQAFPAGLQTPQDYVAVLAILMDEKHSSMAAEILLSEIADRPKELIAKDIDAMGGVLIVSAEDVNRVRRQLAMVRAQNTPGGRV